MIQKRLTCDIHLMRYHRMKLKKKQKNTVGRCRCRDESDTYRLRLVETEDEAGFYDHAAQSHANQQEQQGLCCPSTPSPLVQPGWYRRPGGVAVHHKHRGVLILGHTNSSLPLGEKRCVGISSRSCQRMLLQRVRRDKQRLETRETERCEEVAKWVGSLAVGSSGDGV